MPAPISTRLTDGVFEIRFERPERLNALDPEVADALLAAAQSVPRDGSARAILLSAAGRAFMAGGDLAYLRSAKERPMAARRLIEPMNAAVLLLTESDLPIISAVQGAVAGAGLSLALAADLVVAAEDVRFNLAYLSVATTPDGGGSWFLPRRVGPAKAMELALLCPTVGADEALRIGLVNRVVSLEGLPEAARDLAVRLAVAAPHAVAATRRLLRDSELASLPRQLEAERLSFEACAATDDFGEALDAFFEKRRPAFTGR